MNTQERLLFEQYVTFDMIDFNDGMLYLNYLLNMRDLTNPFGKSEEFIKTELVMVDFKKEKDSIYFSGAFTLLNEGESENRSITGNVYRENGKVVFYMDVFRHNDSLEESEQNYNVCEMFTPNRDGKTYKRFSSYKTSEGLENFLEPKYSMSDKELEEFIKLKTSGIKKL